MNGGPHNAGAALDAEELIAQEQNKLEFFHESLTQCQTLTNNMNSVLNGLESKLRNLQKTLQPLQQATKDVALAEENINKAMDELQTVVHYHKLSSEDVESVKRRQLRSTLDKEKRKERTIWMRCCSDVKTDEGRRVVMTSHLKKNESNNI